MQKRTILSVGTWVALVTILWIIGWIIAESIPVFNNLLSLIVGFYLPCLLWVILTWGIDRPLR